MSETFAERFPAAAANKPSAEDLDAHAAEQKAAGKPLCDTTQDFGLLPAPSVPEEAFKMLAQAQADADAASGAQPIAKPEPTKEQLQKLADEFKQKFGSHNGLRTLPNGSIVVEVVIDVDLAGSLIAWAEGAGEPVAEYVQKQISEALMSFMGG